MLLTKTAIDVLSFDLARFPQNFLSNTSIYSRHVELRLDRRVLCKNRWKYLLSLRSMRLLLLSLYQKDSLCTTVKLINQEGRQCLFKWEVEGTPRLAWFGATTASSNNRFSATLCYRFNDQGLIAQHGITQLIPPDCFYSWHSNNLYQTPGLVRSIDAQKIKLEYL